MKLTISSSALVAVYIMMLKSSSAIPADKSSSTKSFTNTLKTRDLAGPVEGKMYSDSQGTFWNGATWVQGCLFQDWPQPEGLPYLALATNLYGLATYCGACLLVTPSGKKSPSAIAIVNSECPDCPTNGLDMSPDLYNALMGNEPGRVGLSHFDWKVVECPLPKTSNMMIISKDGASRWHLSLQVTNTFSPVIKVEVNVEGIWISTSRTKYNYWEFPKGQLVASVVEQPAIRVTCLEGEPVTIPNVEIVSRHIVTAEGNC